jgi:hypothetical protein
MLCLLCYIMLCYVILSYLTADTVLDGPLRLLDAPVVLGHPRPDTLGAVVAHERHLKLTLLVQSLALHVDRLKGTGRWIVGRRRSRMCVREGVRVCVCVGCGGVRVCV